MEALLANLSTKVRRATRNGHEYLVAPLSLIVPGVLNGSKGALYYPPEEVAADPAVWNRVPMVVYHPTENGEHVSARSPSVLDRAHIGDVFNARVDKRGRLVAEGWFDVEATRRVDNRVLQSLKAGQRIELSTGLFTDNYKAPRGANYNGRGYEYVARNYRPDHLAILPDQTGACSINDGCGVNVNRRKPTKNAAVNQPKSSSSGKFKRNGAGTGSGEDHEAAQRGAMQLTEEDHAQGALAMAEAEAGHNPPSWVMDEDKWERAKAAADKGGYDGESYYAVVAHIYKNMHGMIQSAVGNRRRRSMSTRNAFCPTGKGGGIDPSCSGGGGGGTPWSNLGTGKWSGPAKASDIRDSFVRKTGFTGFSGAQHLGKLKLSGEPVQATLSEPNRTGLKSDGKNLHLAVKAYVKSRGFKSAKAVLPHHKAYEDQHGNRIEIYTLGKSQYVNFVSGKGVTKNQRSGDGRRATRGERNMKRLSERQRQAIVNGLIANECCWEEEDREMLESLSDNRLVQFKRQADEEKETALAVNTLRKELGAPDDLAVNEMPAFIKKKIEDKEESEDDSGEEEPAENEDPCKPAANKGKKPTTNAGNGTANASKPKTEEEWLSEAPESIRNAVQFARVEGQKQKQSIIERLTANVAKDKKERVVNRLGKMSLGELQDMLDLVPEPAKKKATTNASDDFEDGDLAPLFVGAGAPVSNAGGSDADEDDDVLALPVTNWAQVAEANRARK